MIKKYKIKVQTQLSDERELFERFGKQDGFLKNNDQQYTSLKTMINNKQDKNDQMKESSLRDLDDKMKWLKNFERLLEIQVLFIIIFIDNFIIVIEVDDASLSTTSSS